MKGYEDPRARAPKAHQQEQEEGVAVVAVHNIPVANQADGVPASKHEADRRGCYPMHEWVAVTGSCRQHARVVPPTQ